MIVLWVVGISALTHEPDEKVSVDAFVVMQRYEIEVVQAQHASNKHDRDDADLPRALRNLLVTHASRFVGLDSAAFGTRFFTA